MKIYRYPLEVTDDQEIVIQGIVLSVVSQNGQDLVLYATHDERVPKHKVMIHISGTGTPIPERILHGWHFVSTVVIYNGKMSVHIFMKEDEKTFLPGEYLEKRRKCGKKGRIDFEDLDLAKMFPDMVESEHPGYIEDGEMEAEDIPGLFEDEDTKEEEKTEDKNKEEEEDPKKEEVEEDKNKPTPLSEAERKKNLSVLAFAMAANTKEGK